MKPVFGIDVTHSKANQDFNSAPFVAAAPSEVNIREYDRCQEGLEKLVKKSTLPLWAMLAKYIVGGFGVTVVLIFLANGFQLGFATVWGNAPALIVSGFLCLLLGAALWIYERVIRRSAENSNAAEQLNRDMERLLPAIRADLQVPENACELDILIYRYKEKNGEAAPVSYPLANFQISAFLTGNRLCLADVEHRYEFPLEELKRLRAVDKRVLLSGWNKPISPMDPLYKPHKLSVTHAGLISCRGYLALELERDGTAYEIRFPAYERAAVETLTELKAEGEIDRKG
ncbi:MAG: hypothetical protein E7620_06765 [Ruminococcaceae bacterium]|nr:hypothetical protein [Oscillospiraceae bacterium]